MHILLITELHSSIFYFPVLWLLDTSFIFPFYRLSIRKLPESKYGSKAYSSCHSLLVPRIFCKHKELSFLLEEIKLRYAVVERVG